MSTPEVKPEANTPAEAPKPGTPEYDAAMAAKFENRGVVADPSADESKKPEAKPEPAQRPDWFPDNLWKADKSLEENTQALAASYAEARKAISQKAPENKPAPAAAPAVDPAKKALEDALAAVKAKADAKPEEVQAAEKALAEYKPAAPQVQPKEVAQAALAKANEEFAANGKLSDETYEKFEQLGLDRSVLDMHMRGMEALQREYNGKAYAAAGGEEQYMAMIEWAKTGLQPAERAAFDNAVTSGDEAAMLLAVQGLGAKYTAANGKQPALLGGARPANTSDGFKSTAEMTAAMRDPRYAKDPAYRAEVERRIAAASF